MIGARIWKEGKFIQDWVGAQTPRCCCLQELCFPIFGNVLAGDAKVWVYDLLLFY